MDFQELTNKQIESEIAEVVGRVHGHLDWWAQQHFLLQLPNLPEKHYAHTPLGLSLRAILDHITGAQPSPETVRDSCQLVCEALFVAPGNAGAGYEIPESFWETLTGQAIRAVFGGARREIADDEIIETAEACELAGVSREALRLWRESGRLKAADQKGATGGFRYRASDVRKAAGLLS